MQFQNFSIFIAALALVMVSASLNALFGYSWGRLEVSGILIDGIVLAIAAIASDILKSQCLPKILQGVRSKGYIRVFPALVLLVVTAFYSFVAAMGYVSTLRSDKADTQNAQNRAYERLQHDYKQALSELRQIGFVRSYGEIRADIDKILLDPRSEGCKTINGPFTRQWCPVVKTLQAELAKSERLNASKNRIEVAKIALKNAPSPKDADPQVTFISNLTGLDKETVGLSLSILVSVLVEIGSICGFALIGSPVRKMKKVDLHQRIEQCSVPLDKEDALGWLKQYGQRTNGLVEATNRTLADVWGVSASTVNRWLRDWEKQSLLRIDTCSGRTSVMVF